MCIHGHTPAGEMDLREEHVQKNQPQRLWSYIRSVDFKVRGEMRRGLLSQDTDTNGARSPWVPAVSYTHLTLPTIVGV